MSVSVNDVIGKTCNIKDVSQLWVWINNKQLRNVKSGTCLDVNGAVKDWTRLSVSACDHLSTSQLSSCNQDLVFVNGTNLNMNYGNFDIPRVVLFHGNGTYGQWKIFGTSAGICERKP